MLLGTGDLPCWSGGGFDQRTHSFTIQTLGLTEVHNVEDDTLENERTLVRLQLIVGG